MNDALMVQCGSCGKPTHAGEGTSKCAACGADVVPSAESGGAAIVAPPKAHISWRDVAEPAAAQVHVPGALGLEERLKLERSHGSGANWFFWIAGLSIVNSLSMMADANLGFPVGLGASLVIDVIGKGLGPAGTIAGLLLNGIIVASFCGFAVFAKRGAKWAFVAGMVLYGLDAGLFAIMQDWISVGFHVFALFWIYVGMTARDKLAHDNEQRELAHAAAARAGAQRASVFAE